MSLLESFHKLKTDQIQDLILNSQIIIEKKLFSNKVIDNYWTFLKENAEELADLDFNQYNGAVFLYALTYLEQVQKIDITKSEFQEYADQLTKNRESSIFLFTEQTKKKYSDLLRSERFEIENIQQYNSDAYGEDEHETAKACLEAIKLLKKHIDSIQGPNEFILFGLG